MSELSVSAEYCRPNRTGHSVSGEQLQAGRVVTALACGCDYWTVSLDGEPGFTTEERVAAHESRHATAGRRADCWWCHKSAAECASGPTRCCIDCHHAPVGESPQDVTYQEAILDGADPTDGFYE